MHRKILAIIFFLLLLGTFNLASASMIYVDDDNIIGPWDGTESQPYQKIQDGVNAANSGDTIYVKNGLYVEDVIVNETVEIIGENKESTIIEGDSSVFELNADSVSISNFTIGDSRVSRGIEVNSNLNEISNNKITWALYGIYLAKNTGNNTISNNNISNCDYGIGISESSNNKIFDNIFTNRNPTYSSGIGINFYFYSKNNLVYNNDFLSKSYGIKIYTGENNQIYDNNIIDGNYGLYLSQISSSDSNTPNIYTNNVIDNNEIGIKAEEDQVDSIIGNTISNSEKGIELREYPIGTIENNEIKDNDYGIYIYQPEDESLNNTLTSNNIFSDNTEDIKFYNYSSEWSDILNKYSSNKSDGNWYLIAYIILAIIIIIGVIFLLIRSNKKQKELSTKKRPLGITIIAILSIIAVILLIIQQILSSISLFYYFGSFGIYTLIFGVIPILIIMLYISLAYGFIKGKRWSWFLGFIWFIILMIFLSIYAFITSFFSGFSEDFEIIFIIFNTLFIVFIVLYGIGLFYLTRKHVMEYFGVQFKGFFSSSKNLTRTVIAIFIICMIVGTSNFVSNYSPYMGPIKISNFDYLPKDAELGEPVTFYAKIEGLSDNHVVYLHSNRYCDGNSEGGGSSWMENINGSEYKATAWLPTDMSGTVGETCTNKMVKYQIYIYDKEDMDDPFMSFYHTSPIVKSKEITFSN